MKCFTMECFSKAVAESKVTGKQLCIECALKVAKRYGVNTIKTLDGGGFPWDQRSLKICPSCGIHYNEYLIGTTGDCPSCRKPLQEYSSSWNSVDVTYKEGPHD